MGEDLDHSLLAVYVKIIYDQVVVQMGGFCMQSCRIWFQSFPVTIQNSITMLHPAVLNLAC